MVLGTHVSVLALLLEYGIEKESAIAIRIAINSVMYIVTSTLAVSCVMTLVRIGSPMSRTLAFVIGIVMFKD